MLPLVSWSCTIFFNSARHCTVLCVQLHLSLSSLSRDSTQLFGDLRQDKRDGTDGGVSMKAEALETDLFEESVQMRW